MSTSKGRGAAAHTIAEVIPPEQLRFLFLRHRPEPGASSSIPTAPTRSRACSTSSTGSRPRPPAARSRASCRPATRRPSATRCSIPTPTSRPRRPRSGRRSRTSRCSSRSRASTSRPASRRRRGAPLDRPTSERSSTNASPRPARWLEAYAPGAAAARGPARRASRPRPSASTPTSARFLARARRRGRRRRAGRGRAWQAAIFAVAADAGRRRPAGRSTPSTSRSSAGPTARAPAGCWPASTRRSSSAGSRGRRLATGSGRRRRRHERRPAAAPRRARRDPPGRDRQGRGPGARRPAPSSSTPSGAACSAESDGLKAERNAASQADRRGDQGRRGARRPRGRRAARRVAPRPATGSRSSTRRSPTAEAELDDLLLRIPNPADPDVPVGGEEANVTVRTWGEQLAHDQPLDGEVGADAPAGGATWTRKPHWELGEALDIIDNARGAKIAGSGFPVYKGAGLGAPARPDQLVPRRPHARERHDRGLAAGRRQHGDRARGTGQIPDKEDQMYVVTRDELYLVPTAEVPVTNLHRDEILEADAAADPLRGLLAVLPARGRRRRQGHPRHPARPPVRQGRDGPVRAARRTRPAALEWMTERAEILLQRLGLAYRVLLMSTREMGFTQAQASTTSRSGRRASSAGSRSARARTSATTRRAGWRSATGPSRARSRSSSTRSTAPGSRWRGSSPRSSRPTSGPTARSRSPRCSAVPGARYHRAGLTGAPLRRGKSVQIGPRRTSAAAYARDPTHPASASARAPVSRSTSSSCSLSS